MLSQRFAQRAAALLDSSTLRRFGFGLAVVLGVALLALPMLQAGPAPLSSDESLYLSEGYNIATGVGPKYTSQELINHRAPLFPALLSIPLKVSGGDPDSAYWVPKLIVLALAAATFLLASQLFGKVAGALAALLVMANAFLRWMGTTLFLDGAETLFLLLFLSATWHAFQTGSARWFALSGLLLGSAFLTKEAAVQWLPLPVAFALLSQRYRNRKIALGLAAYMTAAGSLLAIWWVWVLATTGRVYFWGEPDVRLGVFAALLVAGLLVVVVAWVAGRRAVPARLPAIATGAGIALVVIWAGSLLYFLETASGWPFPREHWRTVPAYLWQVAAPNSEPWLLVAAGALWLPTRWRNDPGARLLTLGIIFFVPFALLIANRSLEYRDVLPMLYLAYIGAAGLAAHWLERASERAGALVLAGAALAVLAVLGAVQTQQLVDERLPFDRAAVQQSNWDNPLVHSTAEWIHENIPEGSGVMSSRLYYAHLYVLDEGRHPIYQLPTLRVEPTSGETPFLSRATTMFRWEDHRIGEPQRDERWLYVQRYPVKGYYVGLSERDLLRDLEDRDVDFLVITGEDAGFSSLSYLDYFEDHPAFETVYTDRRSADAAVHIFEVDRAALALRPYRAVVSAATIASLESAFDGAIPDELIRAVDPDGITTRR